jgi:rhodanese-related sulfurtransferase
MEWTWYLCLMRTKTGSLVLISAFLLAEACGQGPKALQPARFAEKAGASTSIVIDVRTAEEFKEGHLPNAVNIDWFSDDFEDKAKQLNKSATLLVYCKSGSRSAAAAKKLRKLEYNPVYELDGGIDKWQEARLPVVKE